jgi:hypothetical protein
MSQQQKTLAALYDELRTIQVFDRVHEYSSKPDAADDQAYARRQIRRAQIIAEIQRIHESKPPRHPRWTSVLQMVQFGSSH